MKVVVITGSTRGIGLGLAESFLARDCVVVVSGRTQKSTNAAMGILTSKHQEDHILCVPCDVRDPHDVQNLWEIAKSHFGKIDIWINNAGLSGTIAKIWELDTLQVQAVVETNILGTIYGSQVAVKGMMDQGFGAIYNMEGMGSDGRRHTDGLAVYGMSKYGLNYFNKCLVDEVKGNPITIGMLKPGMVMTEFVTSQFADRPEEFEHSKKIFNIIADRVDTVTPWLADKILANQKSGVTISWSNSWKIMGRFLMSTFKKRDLFRD